MCGRIVRTSPVEVLTAEFGTEAPSGVDFGPRWNLCPGEDLLVVVRAGDTRRMGTVRWGLVPPFAKSPGVGPRAINARAETAASRPAFRRAFRQRRCLVVADGFYEWHRDGNARTPYFLRLRSGRPMALAGLWERWRSPEGRALVSGAVVTCASVGRLAEIHDRMPVILEDEARERWLDPTLDDPAALAALCVPLPERELVVHRVSSFVNAPANDSPECVRPVPDDG